MIYKKLVRDKIPEIISATGAKAITRKLNPEQYTKELKNKLNEEIAEFNKDDNLEELADIVEVIHAIVEDKGYKIEDLEKERKSKSEKKGAFLKKIFLESTDD